MKTLTRPLLLLLLFSFSLNAQKVMQLKEGDTSPNAYLKQVDWIEGHWRGEAFGGIAEEIWSPPLGGSMMFSFKLADENGISFYELGHIIEKENTILMQLKHFDSVLRGWESKEETIDFKLVKIEPGIVYFDGLTMEKIDENHINVYVRVGNEEEGKAKEVLFAYERYKS